MLFKYQNSIGIYKTVQHVRLNRGPHKKGAPTRGPTNFCNITISENLNNFVALNSSPFVLYLYNVMRVFNKMSMITTLSLCVSCELHSVGRYSYVREGPPHFFLNRALLRLNPALSESVFIMQFNLHLKK